MLRCVLYIPPGRAFTQWHDICARYAHDHRYLVVAIATAWVDVLTMLAANEAAVAVVGRPEHLPPDRTPRIEFVSDAPADLSPTPTSRRPKRRDRAAR